MNQWSIRRKRIILSIVLIFLIVVVGLPLYFFLHQKPTCFDQRRNGDESGVDCGGSCSLICPAESLPVISKGDPRLIRVSDKTFVTLINLENPNVYGMINRAEYTIKYFNASSSVPIKTILGKTFVPKSSTFAIFEGPYVFEDAIPTRATFAWSEDTLVWQKDERVTPDLAIENITLSGATTSARLDARLLNKSLSAVSNIELVAVVSDPSGNVVTAGKTFVDSIDPGAFTPLVFVWNSGFVNPTNVAEIFLRILPDRSFIK
ncbi:MAG: hypothetical protein AB200_01835 [Parcubacteria bacterium C7867-005]|nr:MAG: hypothetical protein AB200_01835 [Parcubacteria bacterium C7867-005]